MSGVPFWSVTVAVQSEPVLPAAMVDGLQATEIRGTPEGATVIRVEPTAVSPPTLDA